MIISAAHIVLLNSLKAVNRGGKTVGDQMRKRLKSLVICCREIVRGTKFFGFFRKKYLLMHDLIDFPRREIEHAKCRELRSTRNTVRADCG